MTGAVFPLYSYRKNCSPSPAPATQLVLPDSLQLLPALTLGLLKNPIFRYCRGPFPAHRTWIDCSRYLYRASP